MSYNIYKFQGLDRAWISLGPFCLITGGRGSNPRQEYCDLNQTWK